MGKQVYGQAASTGVDPWAMIEEPGVRRRAEFYYARVGCALRSLRLAYECFARGKTAPATGEARSTSRYRRKLLYVQIPSIGPIRAGVLIGLAGSRRQDRFRTKRQAPGLTVGCDRNPRQRRDTHDYVNGQLQRSQKENNRFAALPHQFHIISTACSRISSRVPQPLAAASRVDHFRGFTLLMISKGIMAR